jgi:hypothetical protein
MDMSAELAYGRKMGQLEKGISPMTTCRSNSSGPNTNYTKVKMHLCWILSGGSIFSLLSTGSVESFQSLVP